ncbi:MAG: B12-binding domain-containing radical SAM protein [Planctomycetota bacterium]|jgi:radical SAM superfamily enzyme YgiQ (UPF0313 family)
MRRIVLYEPATHRPHVFTNFRLPRLGTLLLGTILKERGYDVKVFADVVRAPTTDELLEADLVGISTLALTAPRAYQVADALRDRGIPVVLGGTHATFMTEEALGHADYVFRGEAELSIVALVEAVVSGHGLEDVRGLSFRSGGAVIHNEPAEPVCNLDDLPDPDFSLLVGGLRTAWTRTIVPVQTSRGCPHDCFFCSVTRMFGRKVRYQSVGRVLDGLERMDLRGKHVFFYDDHFAASRSRLREIMEGIISRGIRFDWSAQVRIDVARDEDLVQLMHRAGCRLLYAGIESVNPETLKAFHKGQTVEEIERAIEVFRRSRVALHGMFMFGADTDTIESIRATARFSRERSVGTAQYMILTPAPETPFFDKLDREGRVRIRDWSLYDGQHAVFEPTNMTAYELHRETERAYNEFYSTPRIFGQFARGKILPAVAMVYGRRMGRRFERVNRYFVEGLRNGSNGSGGNDSGRAPRVRLAGAAVTPAPAR